MKNNRPKKDIKPIKLKNIIYGEELRNSYSQEIFKKAPFFPKPLEYVDIDIAFKEFIDTKIDILYDNKQIPTFTLYSNQRFSEYSQTWQHTDDNNNLLMNFKTVVRDTNPKNGTNQGNLWTIPGDRRYTLLMRDVIDENGIECYEIHSMKQPYTVDLLYKVAFVTNKFEKLNEFNQKINKLFSSRQCYIRPNGHYIPMTLEEISDDTEYSIENRKFYTQSCDIRVMAYIIEDKDFKIELKPKRNTISMVDDITNSKTSVEIEENEINKNNINMKEVNIFINFDELQTKTKFIIDTDVKITEIKTNNIRNYRLWVNNTLIYTEKGFSVKENDEILIKINVFDENDKSSIILYGLNEKISITNEINESVIEDNSEKEIIFY